MRRLDNIDQDLCPVHRNIKDDMRAYDRLSPRDREAFAGAAFNWCVLCYGDEHNVPAILDFEDRCVIAESPYRPSIVRQFRLTTPI